MQLVRVRFNRVASEIVFQPLRPETGASKHVERVIAAAVFVLHLHFYLRGVTDGTRPHWKLPVVLVRKCLLEVVNFKEDFLVGDTAALEGTAQECQAKAADLRPRPRVGLRSWRRACEGEDRVLREDSWR